MQDTVILEYILADALSKQLSRPMVLISSLKRHKHNPIIKFNSQADRPPLVYGIYEKDNQEIFLPFFHNRNWKIRALKLKRFNKFACETETFLASHCTTKSLKVKGTVSQDFWVLIFPENDSCILIV